MSIRQQTETDCASRARWLILRISPYLRGWLRLAAQILDAPKETRMEKTMNKLFAETDWVEWEVHDRCFTKEKEDALAHTIEHMAKRMNIFSRAEFPTDFGIAVLTKIEVEIETEEKGKCACYQFELKGIFSIPKVEGILFLHC